ncbi:M20/M25/M40 family metallo-hydrolase [Pseudoclavibacter alba]|uniref:M20/M25/M40 family metallo-hydrolase n=1 Tax=Pseudoclavibacter albus TaxID=272241 RepID=UPI0019D01DBA|nr:M20/M25/M40 family metallo-hydrolase [Pseudoclavibacter alba]MBN6778046.1 M20/M25/M40 family metallo-hydrolase [Pseudoclavibacter alba]
MTDDTLLHDPTVELTRELIRFDTSNYGEGKSKGETECAEFLAARFEKLGLTIDMFESAPRRTSFVTRIEGTDRSKPALVVHGHTDVVPADPAQWSVDPFEAVVKDGCVWGRGAVDMKNMDAMIVTAIEEIFANGQRPSRDLIVAMFADEENGGQFGSHYAVRERPELFKGATTAISEVGGYSVTIGDERAYLVQTGEKAMLWIKLRVHKPAGHGSRVVPAEQNAISTLARAIARLAEHEWPIMLNDTTERMVRELAELLKMDPSDPQKIAENSGKAAGFLTASLRTTSNPTMLQAGYKHNVIPEEATVAIDVRPFPGKEDEALREIQQIVGDEVEIEMSWRDVGAEAPASGPLFDAAVTALHKHDPGARVIPYFLSAGTDNKALSKLGIHGYGFAPLKLPAELDFPGMFHGIDERVPLDALVFGRHVLCDFLLEY